MFKKTALIAGIGLALSATAQADYQWELGAGYAGGKVDSTLKTDTGTTSNNNDTDVWTVDGTWYMETVDTSKGPLGEAAFLDHASNITLAFTDGTVDFSNFDNEDGQTYSVSSRYVAEGPGWKLSGWLMDLGYERREPGDAEIDFYNIGIGKYITPNTTFVFNYDRIDVNNGNDTNGYSADLAHFFAFSSGGLKVNAGGGKVVVSGADDVEVYDVGATWYLNNNWGIGADYQNTSQDGYELAGYAANIQWFITESFAVDLAYEQVDPDDIKFGNGDKLETEIDQYSISALYRF